MTTPGGLRPEDQEMIERLARVEEMTVDELEGYVRSLDETVRNAGADAAQWAGLREIVLNRITDLHRAEAPPAMSPESVGGEVWPLKPACGQ